jgi:hypothetical protein
MRAGVALVTAAAMLAAPVLASAQCKADIDCKGNRICDRGRCVSEEERVTVRRGRRYEPPPPADPGWSLPAAIVGVFGGLVVSGLSLYAELVLQNQPSTATALELGAFVLLAAVAPVVFAGGKSARNQTAVNGVTGLRIAGWVFYGITLAVAGVVLLTRLGDTDTPDGLITGTGAAGALTIACFSIDAVVGWHEAEKIAARDPGWAPVIGMAIENDGGRLPTIGAAARF